MSTDGLYPLSAIVDEIMRARGRLLSATADFGAAEGLTGSQNTVLTAVAEAVRPPTVPQIGRSLGHTRQAIQQIADSLVAQGLIEAVDNPDHKRAKLLRLTERGHEVHAAVERRSRAWQVRIAEGIDPAELAAAASTLRLLRNRLESDAAAPASTAEADTS